MKIPETINDLIHMRGNRGAAALLGISTDALSKVHDLESPIPRANDSYYRIAKNLGCLIEDLRPHIYYGGKDNGNI